MSALPPLLAPSDLAARLEVADLRVLDIRSGPDAAAAFAAGHVPGAVHADYAGAGWRVAAGGAPGLLPPAEHLARLLGRLGITPASEVVVVSAGDLSTAARVFWTLRSAGHRAVAVLDGGLAAWTAEGRPLATGPSPDLAGADYPVRLDETWRARREAVEEAVASKAATLVDSRGESDFLGLTKSPHAPRGGRLPGAIHLDQARLVDPATRRLRPRRELEAIAAEAPDGPAIVYCNTGQAAASDWFVMSEILGRPDVRLYDGSMSDWTQDPGRPVETGPAEAAERG